MGHGTQVSMFGAQNHWTWGGNEGKVKKDEDEEGGWGAREQSERNKDFSPEGMTNETCAAKTQQENIPSPGHRV